MNIEFQNTSTFTSDTSVEQPDLDDLITNINLKKELQAAFTKAGLLPSAQNYRHSWNRIYEFGDIIQNKITASISPKLWNKTLNSGQYGLSKKDTTRILGFGALLTEYMTAPIHLKKSDAEEIIFLGALANFIVTYFDYLIDQGCSHTSILSTERPKSTNLFTKYSQYVLYLMQPPHTRLIQQSVRLYYKTLHNISCVKERPNIKTFIEQLIRKMYQAEISTVNCEATLTSTKSIRRKSALPFVVMGVPSWLTTEQTNPALLRWHLRWMYRLGVLIGEIDDAVDIRDDLLNGHSNGLAIQLKASSNPYDMISQKPTQLSSTGVRIEKSWRSHLPESISPNKSASHALQAVICSWLGGTTT